MSTNNKIFVDSSVFVEALKGNKVPFYQNLVSRLDTLCVNETVVSEYLYHLLGTSAGVSPKTLKERGSIPNIVARQLNRIVILNDFNFLETTQAIFEIVPHLMIEYNLLPNDAIILATCKIHGITQLASHDTDFILPCKAEGIELLREEEYF